MCHILCFHRRKLFIRHAFCERKPLCSARKQISGSHCCPALYACTVQVLLIAPMHLSVESSQQFDHLSNRSMSYTLMSPTQFNCKIQCILMLLTLRASSPNKMQLQQYHARAAQYLETETCRHVVCISQALSGIGWLL